MLGESIEDIEVLNIVHLAMELEILVVEEYYSLLTV